MPEISEGPDEPLVLGSIPRYAYVAEANVMGSRCATWTDWPSLLILMSVGIAGDVELASLLEPSHSP